MTSERVRTILGVWMPMALGIAIIATAINFYITADLGGGIWVQDLESWRLVCAAGAAFIGAIGILSTYGRYKKTKAARRESPTRP